MNTSTFLTLLRSHSQLPLVFRADADLIDPGYHLTEVKRVSFETMDCGGELHDWTEMQFELWVPGLTASDENRVPMVAAKFLKIVERVDAPLPLVPDAPVRIVAEFGKAPAAVYDVAHIRTSRGHLEVELTAPRTRCKAAERRAALASGDSFANDLVGVQETGGGCGCSGSRADAAQVACCR